MFDLAGYIAERVQRAGVQDFEDLGLCTYAEPERFYSYRRTTRLGEPDYGRHINAISFAGQAGNPQGGARSLDSAGFQPLP